MKARQWLRKPKAMAAVLLTTGVLAFSAGQGGDAAQEVHNWSGAAGAVVTRIDSGHQRVATAELPPPPADGVLEDASIDGYALGLALEEVTEHLGRDLSEASGSDLEETLENVHEAVCLVFISYLEQGEIPESPAEMEMQIERFLARRYFPLRELPQVRRDLETLYEMARQVGSIERLKAEVADGVLC